MSRYFFSAFFLFNDTKSIILGGFASVILYSASLESFNYLLGAFDLGERLVGLLQVGVVLVDLGCVGAFLVTFIVLVLFVVFVVAESVLALLDFAVQVEVSVARCHFILVQLVFVVNSFRFKSRRFFFLLLLLSLYNCLL